MATMQLVSPKVDNFWEQLLNVVQILQWKIWWQWEVSTKVSMEFQIVQESLTLYVTLLER